MKLANVVRAGAVAAVAAGVFKLSDNAELGGDVERLFDGAYTGAKMLAFSGGGAAIGAGCGAAYGLLPRSKWLKTVKAGTALGGMVGFATGAFVEYEAIKLQDLNSEWKGRDTRIAHDGEVSAIEDDRWVVPEEYQLG